MKLPKRTPSPDDGASPLTPEEQAVLAEIEAADEAHGRDLTRPEFLLGCLTVCVVWLGAVWAIVRIVEAVIS